MLQLRRDFLRSLEAGFVGLFLIQAVRFVYAGLYARANSADLVERAADRAALGGVPGVVELATVQNEIVALAALLLLPVLALVIGRWRASLPFAVILVALGRSLAIQTPDVEVLAGSLVIGAGLLYMALVIIRRPSFFPVMVLAGLAGDQLIRALGDTRDHSWQSGTVLDVAGYFTVGIEIVISLAAIILIFLSIGLWFVERAESRAEGYTPGPRGVLNIWGALALGGILFLELTVLGLPNVVARWSGVDYAGIVPWMLAATTLPLVPEIRAGAGRFAGMFDGVWRGWLWLLLLGLLIVVGRRYDGIPSAVALALAQFVVGLTLWWLVQTGAPRHNLTALALPFAVVTFGLLMAGEYFTYDYAYVRDFDPPYDSVDEFLRAFREMGLALALIAALLAAIPMILARRRIPWRGGRASYSFLSLLLIVAASAGGAAAAMGNGVRRPASADCLRVATFNIHGGYSQFFDPSLEHVADLIEVNGADVVLLQEVETGRMTSYGVDQVLWLARRLGMESIFFPQNEELQGLAVLSRVPIDRSQGLLLPSEGNQAAALHVVLDPERLVSDPDAAALGGLHVYNAWLGFRLAERDGQPIPEGEQDQNRQMRVLLDWIATAHGPDWTDRILLGGTFNFAPDSPLYRVLRMDNLTNPGIVDPFASLRSDEAMTVFLVNGTAARYDYLWTFNLPLIGMAIDHSPEAARASDHRPAIVAVTRRDGVTCPY